MEENHKKTGTTTVALKCKDGVILAADKRATMGHFISNKEAQKVLQIDDLIAATIAGGVGDAQTIMRLLRAEAKLYKMNRKKPMTIKAAATLMSNILNNSRYYPYLVMSIIAGIDKGPKVFSIDPVGGLMEEDFISTGSGSPIAYGVLEYEFRKEKTVKDNLVVAVKAVKVAQERDAGSGNGVTLVTITEDGGFKQHEDSEISKIISALN
jgi:proteasome beta subunit